MAASRPSEPSWANAPDFMISSVRRRISPFSDGFFFIA
jgi:hypothetical protein